MESSIFASLGINWIDLIGQIINLSILLFLLKKFVYNPVLQKLDERADLVKKSTLAAEKNLKKQEEIEASIKDKFRDAQKEIDKLMDKAKKDSAALQKQLMLKAEEDAKNMVAKRMKQAEEQINSRQKELEDKVVDLAVVVAKKVLADGLDLKSQQKIIDSQLKKIGKISLN